MQEGLGRAIEGEETSLVADFWPHGGVAQAYGLFREQNGFSERAGDSRPGRYCPLAGLPNKSVPDIENPAVTEKVYYGRCMSRGQ